MDWLTEYINAWSRHGIHFGISCGFRTLRRNAVRFRSVLAPFNLLDLNPDLPADVTLTLSVDDECLIYRFPHSRGGHLNCRFLDPTSLLRVLDGLPEGLIAVLPIPQIYRTEELSFEWFLEAVDRFLFKLPGTWRYAIELHNSNYLLPDYFECLRRHNVAHVMHGSFDYPVFTADFGLMLAAGQLEVVHAVRCAVEEKKRLYVYLNDYTSASHLMELLNHDLKKLSPIKRSVAA